MRFRDMICVMLAIVGVMVVPAMIVSAVQQHDFRAKQDQRATIEGRIVKVQMFTRILEPKAPTSGTPEATCQANERSE
jgi:hypothetical protein